MLKAYLIKQGEEIRKIHDLTALVIDCEKYDSAFQELEPLVEGITDFAVEFRYPGGNATPDEMQDALNKTNKVREFLITKIEYWDSSKNFLFMTCAGHRGRAGVCGASMFRLSGAAGTMRMGDMGM